jgi:replicative DNA helicase
MESQRPTGRSGSRGPSRIDAADARRLLEATPPHAPEAEMSLLGAMLIDPRVVGDVIQVVPTGVDFHRPAHGAIFDAMVQIWDRTATLDVIQLNQHLTDKGLLEDVGGTGYLVELAESTPTAAHAVEHARIVRDKATMRELIRAAGEILGHAQSAADEPQQVLEAAEQRIFAIAQRRDGARFSSLQELLDHTLKVIDQSEGKPFTGVPAGFAEFDEMTSGLQKGEMVILAARPSMGKTALALNMMENIAASGHPVAMFSLEMGRQQLVQRILCAKGGIDSQRLRRNMLRKEDYRALLGACEALQNCSIWIDDTPGLSLLSMRSKARRLKEQHGIEAIIIDYLQLMSSGSRVESRQMEVSEISRGIKAMARELEVPVICLSQLNRAAEQREGHKPRMSDLRESGSIEQDADVVLMLHREEYYHQGDDDWLEANADKRGLAELIVAKQRNGPTGVCRLAWDGRLTRFRDFTDAVPPGGFESAPRLRAVTPPDDLPL